MWKRIQDEISRNFHSDVDPNEIIDIREHEDKEFLENSKEALENLEIIRMAKLKVFEFRKKIGIPTAMIATPVCGYIDYWLLMLQRGSDDGGAGVTFLVLGGLYWWVTQPRRQYRKAYKEEILPRLAKLFGDFTYSLTAQIDMIKMMPSKIVPHHDKYKSEDYFAGSYKGVDIEFSEINLQERRRSGKRTRYVTVFKGLGVLLHVKNKDFYGHTIIDRNKSKISEWFKQRTSSLERAEMVDPEFEAIFDAYTNDQVEARYLIDPVMIENLKGLYQEYDGEKMAAAFYKNRMLILIASKKNHFEPANIYTPATSPASILKMKHEIHQILSIIDKLSLYDPREVHRLHQQDGQADTDAA
ncbi:MAG: DUF3137 domain-containing protein [Alphaproteobacteria bacterium]|nr:DUF3137 domain-containing protein [Alphaproteobacteria bacterium]